MFVCECDFCTLTWMFLAHRAYELFMSGLFFCSALEKNVEFKWVCDRFDCLFFWFYSCEECEISNLIFFSICFTELIKNILNEIKINLTNLIQLKNSIEFHKKFKMYSSNALFKIWMRSLSKRIFDSSILNSNEVRRWFDFFFVDYWTIQCHVWVLFRIKGA